MCWFDLVRKMCGFLATSHDTIATNENLVNKPYFCLGLLSNIADLLRPVDSGLTILGIFYPFIPGDIASHWERWVVVERNQLLVNLMCFELPIKLDIRSPEFIVLVVWTATI